METTSLDWITDRQPTEQDGDRDGDVRMRYSPNDSGDVYAHWSYVKNGNPWKHTVTWKPPAPRPPLAVGQVWRRGDGKLVQLTDCDTVNSSYPFYAEGHTYTPAGKFWEGWKSNRLDLVDLISEAPAPKPPEPEATPQPRLFKSITRTPRNFGGYILDAVDEDGVAWYADVSTAIPRVAAWVRTPPLPAREPSHVGSSLPEV